MGFVVGRALKQLHLISWLVSFSTEKGLNVGHSGRDLTEAL